MNQKTIIFLIIIIIIVLAGYWYFSPLENRAAYSREKVWSFLAGFFKISAPPEEEAPATINNFEECAAAGNPVMESYPRQCRANGQVFSEQIVPLLSFEQALYIARENRECAKAGVISDKYIYNDFTQTWWIDLERMPELEKDGCRPACVVSEKNQTAEVNWRCTGLIEPEEPAGEIIRQLFVQKYPKYAETLSVTVEKETANHARGSVSFVSGEPGGLFLAAKIDSQWQIVHEGNGAIACNLAKYGFPNDMLFDCAE